MALRDWRPRAQVIVVAVMALAVALAYFGIAIVLSQVAADPFAGMHAGHVRSDNSLAMEFAWCPPGRFVMGSTRPIDPDETAADVQITRGFWMARHEVTQQQWEKTMGTRPWDRAKRITGPKHPCSFVTWDDANGFCAALTRRERQAGRLPSQWEYRLPTEAAWEYACRAGTSTKYCFGDDPALLGDYSWFGGGFGGIAAEAFGPQPAGLKLPNAWGLYDMHGNVSEFCFDAYARHLPGGRDPCVKESPSDERVIRGGDWFLPAVACSSTNRVGHSADWANGFTGFRVACVRTR